MYTVSESGKMAKLTTIPFPSMESFNVKSSPSSSTRHLVLNDNNSDKNLSMILGFLLIAVGGMVLYNAYKNSKKTKSSLGFGFAL
jgi:hypothetical protein